MLFALLAAFAPVIDAPLRGNELQQLESGDYLSAAADPRSDAASLVRAILGFAEEAEDESDGEEATFLALAALECDAGAEYQAADAWLFSFRPPSAHFCTGPPAL